VHRRGRVLDWIWGDAVGVMNTDEIAALLDGVTPPPWTLCAHLRLHDEAGCSCGYRGVIYAGETEYAICQPGHDPASAGEEGTEPQRLDRAAEIANARFIAASREIVPTLLDRVQELESALSEPVAMILHIADALRENAITLMSAEGDNFGASILGYADRITAAQKEKHHD